MKDDITYIGHRNGYRGQEAVGISSTDRRQHVFVIGKTGTGKSTLLRNLICQDIGRGRGVGVIDPHGELAEELLDCIPPERFDDVVYFNATDTDFPIAFNLFGSSSSDNRHLIASEIVAAFKHQWRYSWGPRLEYILYASIAALMECQNVSLLGVPRMLTDGRFRSWVLKQVKDPVVLAFWRDEFAGYDKRFLAEAIAPIQNKIGQLLMAAPLRNIFGQIKCKIDPRFIMDNSRIFIANLSKGRLGEDKSDLLGSFLVSGFQAAAMERAAVPASERRDFLLFIDEFQNFATDSFASILSEARKYRLNLTLSHQYLAQMSEPIREAVFGNVGSLIAFRVGASDAEELATQMGNEYPARQFSNLPNHMVCAKLMNDGEPRRPFIAEVLPPLACSYGGAESLKRRSREQFGTPRLVAEERIRKWFGK